MTKKPKILLEKKIKFFFEKIWSVQKKVVSLQCKNKKN